MEFTKSERYRYILGWTPKCACTTVLQTHYKLHGEETASRNVDTHAPPVHLMGGRQMTVEEISGLHGEWSLCLVVRNPYQRLLSTYLERFVAHAGHGERSRALSWDDPKFASFASFVEHLRDAAKCDFWHLQQQSKGMLPHLMRRVEEMNFIAVLVDDRFTETFQVAMEALTETPVEIVQGDVHKAHYTKPWKDYYTPELKERVDWYYGDDFVMLNYWGVEIERP